MLKSVFSNFFCSFKYLFQQFYEISISNVSLINLWYQIFYIVILALLSILINRIQTKKYFKVQKKNNMLTDFNDDLNFGISLQTNDAVAQQIQNTSSKPSQPKKYVPSTEQSSKSNSVGKGDYDLSQAAHPSICIATFAFKAVSILMYFPIGYALPTIMMFIIVLVLAAFDFWVVKNISGRLLVGLRWKSQIDQKGKQIWKFESHNEKFSANKVDKAFFWGSQVLGTLIWGFFFVINVLGLHFFNCTLLFICTSMCSLNLYGYYKCRGDHQKKISELKSKYGAQGLMAVAGKFM